MNLYLDTLLMPRTVVETLAIQAEKRVINLLPILPEDDEPLKRMYDPNKIITRKDGTQYRVGINRTPEERRAFEKARKAAWYAKPGVAEEQREKARLRQQKLAERRMAARSASRSTD